MHIPFNMKIRAVDEYIGDIGYIEMINIMKKRITTITDFL